MNLWTIYDNPDDFPAGTFVARRFWLGTATLDVLTGKSLDEVRGKLSRLFPGMAKLDRAPDDDPKIVEVWI